MNEIIPFQKQEFGDLVSLPDKVASWKVETDNLKIAAEKFAAQLPTDLSALTIADLDAFDARLVRTITTIGSAFSKIEAERRAGTAILDEIKAFSMLPEKTIANYPGQFKQHRDAIAREKARRVKEAEEMRNKEVAKKQEAIEIRSKQQQLIRSNFDKHLTAAITAMSRKFYEQTTEAIEPWGQTMKAWAPLMKEERWAEIQKNGGLTVLYFSADEVDAMYKSVAEECEKSLKEEWMMKLFSERDRLLELIPSRRRELEEIAKGNEATKKAAEDRQKQEEDDRQAALLLAQEEQSQALQTAAEVDKTNALFDAESQAEVTSVAKGTVVRRKYVPKTPAAFLPIIQQWVSKELALHTVEELSKKLSFMLTASNKRLNEGETLQHKDLAVVDDYSTRTSRKKEVAV